MLDRGQIYSPLGSLPFVLLSMASTLTVAARVRCRYDVTIAMAPWHSRGQSRHTKHLSLWAASCGVAPPPAKQQLRGRQLPQKNSTACVVCAEIVCSSSAQKDLCTIAIAIPFGRRSTRSKNKPKPTPCNGISSLLYPGSLGNDMPQNTQRAGPFQAVLDVARPRRI